MSILSDLLKKNSAAYGTDQNYGIKSYSLPNNAGSYSASGTTQPQLVPSGPLPGLGKAPISLAPTAPVAPVVKSPTKPIFSGATTPTPTPTAPAFDNSEFINPATGKVWTDQEYADNIATKARGTSVGGYAGGQITDPNQSTADLTAQGRTMNNAANDLATGTTDPYGVASESGIQYTPAQLTAIEKAYAGIYDPAINDVFAKLEERKKLDAEKQARLDKEAENKTWYERQDYANKQDIAKYNATTGAKSAADAAQGTYTIQPGDDLRTIAAKKGLTYEALQAVNTSVDETNLKPGQTINLPNDNAKVTAPKATDPKQLVWMWLASPEGMAKSDDEKRAEIMGMGYNPTDYDL